MYRFCALSDSEPKSKTVYASDITTRAAELPSKTKIYRKSNCNDMKTNTPICDFVKKYAEKKTARFHMPGHKGKNILGCELLDITEIDGADSLYEAGGIIAQSEKTATELFGSYATHYCCEGSSQVIRAMLYLACQVAKSQNRKPVVVATRNAHKVFALTVALLNIDVVWLNGERKNGLCSCVASAEELEAVYAKLPYVTAVYVTSPDYLGNIANVRKLADVAHRHDSMLICDNAHGAYLKFIGNSHPVDNGADMCCDSAHKTLPVLTGGAYLHVANCANDIVKQNAKDALSMFGSTSPSYLILQSLDGFNGLLLDGYADKIRSNVANTNYYKRKFAQMGWKMLASDEPLKITIDARANGYLGNKLAKLLIAKNVVPEYYDPDYVVLMVSAETDYGDFSALQNALASIPLKKPLNKAEFAYPHRAAMHMKKALSLPCETVSIEEAEGKVIASPAVSCPPAVPVLYGGEIVSKQAIEVFAYYGIKTVKVVKQ